MIVRFIYARFLFAAAIAACALLELGLAPQLSAQISNRLSDRLSSADSSALPDARPTPVTRQEVWQAVTAELRKRGLSEPRLPRLEDLELPVAIPAVAGRKLRVAAACWDEAPQRTQFRVECGQPGQCLPFLAYLHHADLHDDRHDSIRDSVLVDACLRPASRPLALEPHPAPQPAPKPPPEPTVRPGEAATAVLLANGLRMTASVICLDRGRAGEVIRVRGLDGYIFRARVSGPGLLEALPQ